MQHVFIVGAKGVSFYGGYESFVQKLLEYHNDHDAIQYHVACKANGEGCMKASQLEGASEVRNKRFCYCGADCFLVHVPNWLGSAQAIVYDMAALRKCCRYIEENRIENAIIYILACRIGPFVSGYIKRLHQLGGKVYLNPDGHEWKRAKWPAPIRRYWKWSERLMVKKADLIICDSVNIENYIRKEYAAYGPQTIYIPYGAETMPSTMADDDPRYVRWLQRHGLRDRQFFISVGRFVPENNYETMIREFMKSRTDKDFAIIATENIKFLNELNQKLHFDDDRRIKFVGTVYDQELLKKIRQNAYGYFHGHEVGGTNPSLLEALGNTRLNLLLDVCFNREVAGETALYWIKKEDSLAELIDRCDKIENKQLDDMGEKARQRVETAYSWGKITAEYEKLFLSRREVMERSCW
ncbi:MAG: DUF1972 domain-containing protein [Clostridium sp.]|nr:DUF1972 domain-containing protein [Ruminococcus flavefaciens]MCM1499460.1 DUF1972 domain-containing protein [Clostridium sp.]